MTIIFNEKDKQGIKNWLIEDKAYPKIKPDNFINYFENILVDIEMASIRGEYEYWRDNNFPTE